MSVLDYLISVSFDTLPLGIFRFYSVSIKVLPVASSFGDGFGDDDIDEQMGSDWVRIRKEHTTSGSDLETTHVFVPKIYLLLSKNYKITVASNYEDINKGILCASSLKEAFLGDNKEATRTNIFMFPKKVLSQLFKLLGQNIPLSESSDNRFLNNKGLDFSIKASYDIINSMTDFNFIQYINRLYAGFGLIVYQTIPRVVDGYRLNNSSISFDLIFLNDLSQLSWAENEGLIAMSETIMYNKIAKYTSIQQGENGDLVPVNPLTPGQNYDTTSQSGKLDKIKSSITKKSVAPTTGEVINITTDLVNYFYDLDPRCKGFGNFSYNSKKVPTFLTFDPEDSKKPGDKFKKEKKAYKTNVKTNKKAPPPKKGKIPDLVSLINKYNNLQPETESAMQANIKKWDQEKEYKDTDTTIEIKSDYLSLIPKEDRPKKIKTLKTAKVDKTELNRTQTTLPNTEDLAKAKLCAETFLYTIMRNTAITKNLIEVYSISGNFFGALPHYSITSIEQNSDFVLPIQKFNTETFEYETIGELQIPEGEYLVLGTHITTKLLAYGESEYESSVTLIKIDYIKDYLTRLPRKTNKEKKFDPVDLSIFINKDGKDISIAEKYIHKFWGGKENTATDKAKAIIKKYNKNDSYKDKEQDGCAQELSSPEIIDAIYKSANLPGPDNPDDPTDPVFFPDGKCYADNPLNDVVGNILGGGDPDIENPIK